MLDPDPKGMLLWISIPPVPSALMIRRAHLCEEMIVVLSPDNVVRVISDDTEYSATCLRVQKLLIPADFAIGYRLRAVTRVHLEEAGIE